MRPCSSRKQLLNFTRPKKIAFSRGFAHTRVESHDMLSQKRASCLLWNRGGVQARRRIRRFLYESKPSKSVRGVRPAARGKSLTSTHGGFLTPNHMACMRRDPIYRAASSLGAYQGMAPCHESACCSYRSKRWRYPSSFSYVFLSRRERNRATNRCTNQREGCPANKAHV